MPQRFGGISFFCFIFSTQQKLLKFPFPVCCTFATHFQPKKGFVRFYFYTSTFWRNFFCFVFVLFFHTTKTIDVFRFRFQFAAPLPHTSRQKRPEEDSGIRYWFCDREDMEYSIKQHEFLEYGEFNGNLYGM